MNLRRSILAVALVVLAVLIAWIAFSPLSGTGRLVVLAVAAYSAGVALVLFRWRAAGSIFALFAGGSAFFMGSVLAGLGSLGNEPLPQALWAAYLGAGIAVMAVIDLILLAMSGRQTDA